MSVGCVQGALAYNRFKDLFSSMTNVGTSAL